MVSVEKIINIGMKSLLISLLFLPLPLFGFNEMNAVQILKENGNLQYTVCAVKTIYANKGDYILYKTTTPRDGMLILTHDDTCVKYNKDVNIDKVVVAIVKRYT
jgi:hypothetical protein